MHSEELLVFLNKQNENGSFLEKCMIESQDKLKNVTENLLDAQRELQEMKDSVQAITKEDVECQTLIGAAYFNQPKRQPTVGAQPNELNSSHKGSESNMTTSRNGPVDKLSSRGSRVGGGGVIKKPIRGGQTLKTYENEQD